MSENQSSESNKARWHLWVIGVLSLLWNAMGAFDYLMTQTQNEAYMSEFTPEQLEFFYNFPSWMVAFWALAVWGGVLGSVLLLLRKAWAVPVFLVSLVCMVVTAFHNFVLANGMELMGGAGTLFTIVIFVIAVFLYMYSKNMRTKGVLG